MASNRICTKCFQNKPSTNYTKNVETNTFFRTCLICRNRDKDRRQKIHQRLRAAASNLDAISTRPINNNEIIAIDSTQSNPCHEIENLVVENSNLARETHQLDCSTTNITHTSNLIHCKGCRKNLDPKAFHDLIQNKSFKQCNDCRHDLYDVSDDDVANLAADIGRFELEEVEEFNGPVPEEAPLGDDPIFLYSQLQSREFRNHDEIQRQLQADEETCGINVLEPDSNIDPFLDEIPQPGNDHDNHLENLDRNNPFIEETPRPRNNEIAQPQNLLPIDPFLESYPPPQAEDVTMIDNNQLHAERSDQVQAR
ncbi:hypothetical protein EV44_g3236 [Erysiphe necator]|uniref:Uncharacterized protein n=1 Tax=Uncinula necator TaxID=52586 RepID=A0A0B1P9I5_UNCNE|nr:hypothetical protein EV44_g3236 [Erysiphe necator]